MLVICPWTAMAIGSIMAALAVLLIHIDRSAVMDINPIITLCI